ncbi:uncharacterized protein LOC114284677 isoform X3 [Camellia sinensis]|uniref:uncharacterized protein LOC114284677 isoform X3 n=1 Tax=Camellia sinensis TaxID=4442 RepID=UPI0010362E5E|nr:uncharacterized protein LOC114284677 isoform X3 [Camellia sinensis]
MSDFFPDEIVVEILQRLPTKSLIQFRTPYVTSKYMHLRRSRNLVIWGVGVKGKDLNGSTSSGQGSCNKEYKRDDDLEEHLRKMKAKSAKMLKKLS